MGLIGDKFGFRKTLHIINFSLLFLTTTFQFIAFNPTLFLIWVAGIFFLVGGRTPNFPSFIYQEFGTSKAAILFPYVNMGSFLGDCVQYGLVVVFSLWLGFPIIIWIITFLTLVGSLSFYAV